MTEAVSHNAIRCVCVCVCVCARARARTRPCVCVCVCGVCNENFSSLFILPLELGACILLSLLLLKFGING